MTLGEKGIPGKDETHYRLPQDVAFLPNGMFLVGDGLGGNNRIVVRNADGSTIRNLVKVVMASINSLQCTRLLWGLSKKSTPSIATSAM